MTVPKGTNLLSAYVQYVLSGFSGKLFKTKSGKEIDISGEHYKNMLSAVIEKLEDKFIS